VLYSLDANNFLQMAEAIPGLGSGNMVWILLTSALVLFVIPGISLFYSGLNSSRKPINTLRIGFIYLTIVFIVWVMLGYSITSGVPLMQAIITTIIITAALAGYVMIFCLTLIIRPIMRSHLALEETSQQLIQETNARKAVEEQANTLGAQLSEVEKQAEMADMMNSMLHNIGNVLNSVNTSTGVIREKIQHSEMLNVRKLVLLLEEHEADLADFFTNNPKGKQIPQYLQMLAITWENDEKILLAEAESLEKNVQHVRNIIALQQSLTKTIGNIEKFSIIEVINDALKLNEAAYKRASVALDQKIETIPMIVSDKIKITQIMVNLIKNSIESLLESPAKPKKMGIHLGKKDSDHFVVQITDNGVGIAPENKAKIFSYGFTTKKNGHGFGLHSCILAAQELGGTLSAESDGVGKGAIFTLVLPYRPLSKEVGNVE